jgi:hypothetical protein
MSNREPGSRRMSMTRVIGWRGRAVFGLLLAVLLAGCGGIKKVTVRGKVTRGGEPLLVSPQTYVTITFAPVAEKAGQTYPAKFTHADGSYAVTIPTGNYRAGLLIVPPEGQAPLSSPMDASKTYEIKKDQVIDLDLAR